MHTNSYSQIGKIRLGLLLVILLFAAADLPAVHAQQGVIPVQTSTEADPIVNAVPLNFSKNTPLNGATVQGTTVTLDWGAAGTDITGYYHCFDKTNNNICDGNQWNWNNDTNRTLLNLQVGSTYYWQILACNLTACIGANYGQWWSFTVAPLSTAQAGAAVTPTPDITEHDPVINALPLSFNKRTPANGETVVGTKVTLEWSSAGTGITGYYHCVDLANNGICDSNQWDWNDDTNRTLLNLIPSVSYYWQILACNNEACIGADNGEWWSFNTSLFYHNYMPVILR